jgi:hypothetical protein
MKRSAKKYFFLLLVIITLLFLGYYRDFVFRTMNSMLQAKDHEMPYATPASLQFLDRFSYTQLMNLKWLFTVIFSGLYLVMALITLKIIFNNRKYLSITIGVYIAIMLVSGLFMLGGFAVESTADRMYEFARYLMGMAQSPIILMILIPAFKLSGQEPNNITN